MGWNEKVRVSLEREKAEVEERYRIKIGQTSITCSVCGRPWGFGHRECNPSPERFVPLDVDRERWVDGIRGLRDEYGISEGTKQDSQSSKRIALLVSEFYLYNYRELRTGKGIFHNDPLLNVSIIEKEVYEMAIENKLTCDPLESETRVKDPARRGAVLDIWGIDKKNGFENCRSQLSEWTAITLLGERKDEDGRESESGQVDFGNGLDEGFELEESGIG